MKQALWFFSTYIWHLLKLCDGLVDMVSLLKYLSLRSSNKCLLVTSLLLLITARNASSIFQSVWNWMANIIKQDEPEMLLLLHPINYWRGNTSTQHLNTILCPEWNSFRCYEGRTEMQVSHWLIVPFSTSASTMFKKPTEGRPEGDLTWSSARNMFKISIFHFSQSATLGRAHWERG